MHKLHSNYRGSSPYANFITAIFQNIPDIFGLCVFWANYFITAIFILYAKYRKNAVMELLARKMH